MCFAVCVVFSVSMTSASHNIAIFNGKNDFNIWKKKMKCILIQQRVFKAIDESYVATDMAEKRAEMNDLALSAIILNLSDCVLRKVEDIESAKVLWEKLTELYTDASLPCRLFLQSKFFRYKIDPDKDIDENLDVFTKMLQDIKLTGDKHIEEYAAVVLLNAMPDSWSDVQSAIMYARDNVTLETVVNALKSKEMHVKHSTGSEAQNDEVLHVWGRSQSKDQSNNRNGGNQNQNKNRSKSRSNTSRRCYNCGETGHYVKFCKNPKKVDSKEQPKEHASANVAAENNMAG